MQPNVIQKPPEKAILLLLNIMLIIIVKSSSAIGSSANCEIKIVTKVKLYNELAGAYVKVKNRHVLANDTDEGTLYKISKGDNFYLYDPDVRKYICWRKCSLVAKSYSTVTENCKFQEVVSKFDNTTHVELVGAGKNTAKMMFTSNGSFFKTKCSSLPPHCKRYGKRRQDIDSKFDNMSPKELGKNRSRTQHGKRHGKCRQIIENKAAAFLFDPSATCPKWHEVCSHGLEKTRELKQLCQHKIAGTISTNNV